jgi:hypothetical protein
VVSGEAADGEEGAAILVHVARCRPSPSPSPACLVPGAPLPLRLRCLPARRDQRGIPMASDPGGREIPRGGRADHGGKVAPRGLAPRPRSSLISRPFDWQLALALLAWLLAADADRGGALSPPAYVYVSAWWGIIALVSCSFPLLARSDLMQLVHNLRLEN